ncbi:MAG TPA: GntR family transcriptional regulator, partial [Chloroflexota bacterium]
TAETLDDLHAVFFDLLRPNDRQPIPTAVDHAYEMIWRQLITGERSPGERLTDTELASQLGLSRTPVRQALHRLAQEELVRLDARRGFSVRELTVRDVQEIYDVRGALEVLALRQAAPHLSAEQIQMQLDLLYQMREALRKERDERAVILHLESDLRLHNLLIQASGNGRLIRMLAALRSQQTLFQYWDTSYPQRNEAAADEHERILLALAAGDIEEAGAQLAQHIANAKNRVLFDLFGTREPSDRDGVIEERPRELDQEAPSSRPVKMDDE